MKTRAPSSLGAIDRLLAAPPFGLSDEAKPPLFDEAMSEAFCHHREKNEYFRKICRLAGQAAEGPPAELGDYPYLPATAFKRRVLSSVPEDRITSILLSSATTGEPSRIAVDRLTARRQSVVSARVMAEYLGHHRRPFLVADADPGVEPGRDISARAAAARGFQVFADSLDYAFARDPETAPSDLSGAVGALEKLERCGRDVCVFGFTQLLHARLIRPLLAGGKAFRLPEGSRVAVIGGWKRLRDERVEKADFAADIFRALGIPAGSVFDFYGFTEQMGLVYAGPAGAPKTVPAYAEIIVRDFDSLRPAADGREGLIQVLTPVPHSYPGISVLTDDVGRIVGRGRDESGRWGTRFEVLGRAASAEPRGCGDLKPRELP